MQKATALLIAGLLVAMFVAAAMLQSLLVLERIAAVSDLHGDVKLKPRGEQAFYPLAGRQYVKEGDVIRTGEGTVTLNWVDGTRVKLGPATTLTVLRCHINTATDAAVTTFWLDTGRVWVRILRKLNPRSKFEVRTPTATAGVRGTVFSVEVQPGGATRIGVLEGAVQVRADGRTVTVGSRQVAEIAAGHVHVGAFGPEAEESWKQAEDVLGPYLVVTEPNGAALVQDGKVTVRGLAERGAEVTVNGQPVKRAIGARFQAEVSVPASASELRIVVRAVDQRGRSTVVERRVKLIR